MFYQIQQDLKSLLEVLHVQSAVFVVFAFLLFLCQTLFSSIHDIPKRVIEGIIVWNLGFSDLRQHVVSVDTQQHENVFFKARVELIKQFL